MSLPKNGSLKEALIESVICVLSPDIEIRKQGELQLKTLEVTEEYGIHLTQCSLDQDGAQAVRQLCSVLLKQYVESHWTQYSPKFCPPETPQKSKVRIREILPIGLTDNISKIRSCVAYAVSAIAHWDWPEQWPELFGTLMQTLTSDRAVAVQGTMRVLTEFCREIDNKQVHQVAPVLIPELYKIFTQPDLYSVRTRSRVVDIYNKLASLIAHSNGHDKGSAKQLLYPSLPQFIEVFVKALQQPNGLSCDNGLRIEIVKMLISMTKLLPNKMLKYMDQILPIIWYIFQSTSKIYVETIVNVREDEIDEEVNSDGESMSLDKMIFALFDFIQVLIDCPKLRPLIIKSLQDLTYYIMIYSQITVSMISKWELNPDSFVEDEDEETFSYSVRISAQSTLVDLNEYYSIGMLPSLCAAIMRLLQEADEGKTMNPTGNWWKLHEVVMISLSVVRSNLLIAIRDHNLDYDIIGMIRSVVMPDLTMIVSPFLLGRCITFASKFNSSLPQDLLLSFMQATVHGLSHKQSDTVRISAVRAVYGIASHMKVSKTDSDALAPFLPEMVDSLLSITTQFGKQVLQLTLEALNLVMEVDESFTVSRVNTILPMAIAVFIKYNSDLHLVSLTQELFVVLASNKACYDNVQSRLVPTLCSLLESSQPDLSEDVVVAALESLQGLIRARPNGPLTDLLLNRAFPATIQTILTSTDNAILQNGGECIRAFVSTDLDSIMRWQDSMGVNGVTYVVQVVTKLLDPKTSEFSATFVGRLVSILIYRMGQSLGDNLDLMLRAILSKMLQSETLSVLQSLIMVFVNLIHHQMEAVLDFLSQVPGPSGQPALEFVLAELCSKQHLFYGNFESKVSAMALCKLLQFTIETNDPRLQGIQVKGEIIDDKSSGVKTRSRAVKEPDQWTTIPILVKMYKLIINELAAQYTEESYGIDDDYDTDSDNEFQNDIDTNDFSVSSGLEEITDMIDDTDPDDLSNPLYQVDLKSILFDVLSISESSGEGNAEEDWY